MFILLTIHHPLHAIYVYMTNYMLSPTYYIYLYYYTQVEANNSWFGSCLLVADSPHNPVLIVGAPIRRNCAL